METEPETKQVGVLTRQELLEHSVEVILAGQTPEGAYLAAPTFPTYRYSWFRDGSFIADAMDLVGRHHSAEAFHRWVVEVLERQLAEVARSGPRAVLHTRYLPDGSPGNEEWPNFQLDGFGTWLWAYARHVRTTGSAPSARALAVVADLTEHLLERWPRRNFDCWEEHSDRVHPSTLGALYAGFRAAAELLAERRYLGVADAVRAYLLEHGTCRRRGEGDHGAPHFRKHVAAAGHPAAGGCVVDANLLWLSVPYGVVEPNDPVALGTLAKVRRELQDVDGGLHRYAADTYYGGGSWLLLTCDLAQVHLALGQRAEAERLIAWVEDQVTTDGDMPEQVATHVNDPSFIPQWEATWGTSAAPLLWSHAAYLRALAALDAPAAREATVEPAALTAPEELT